MSKVQEIQRAYQKVPTLLEASHNRQSGDDVGYVSSPSLDKSASLIPPEFERKQIVHFPKLSEAEVVRHFTQLSCLNFGLDTGFYPLGSCTMKYNPKINEQVVCEEGFSCLHPYTPEEHAQGALEVMFLLQQALMSITGHRGCSLHPAAGAHGEMVGVKMIRAYHTKQGDKKRRCILVPDSAHGTNPASAALCGFSVKAVKSNEQGVLDVKNVDRMMDDTVAGLMVTVPNTLGIFESHIVEIAQLVHDRGGLLYCDGANLNALVGRVDFEVMGVDAMHINLHKTFSTPHGGGGPGAGPVVVSEKLIDFLPIRVVKRKMDGTFFLDESVPHSVGKFRAFYGNFAMLVRALCYIQSLGFEHLSKISEVAVLNANYLKARLRKHFHLPIDAKTLHEVVFCDKIQQRDNHVSTLDIAKRLMDFGIHPPTIYFPLVVKGALMIEPTETESKRELDRFADVMIQIAEEAKTNPAKVLGAPHNLGITRLDETKAAREPVLTWNPKDSKSSRTDEMGAVVVKTGLEA